MSSTTWTAVDRYLTDVFIGNDPAVDNALAASDKAGLPAIAVSPTQGKQLYLLALIRGARRILEIGTLGGYSTIWLARALPADGKLITLEADAKHAEVARSNIRDAGLGDKVEIRVGRALDTLPTLAGPFDLFFIDADKTSIPDYFQWSLKLSRPGTVIIVDNVVRDGAIIDADGDAAVKGVRRFNDLVAAEKRVTGTTIQTVGSKGYDGFAMLVVKG
jgi:predicted O-methyltransferase YrrM